MEFSLDNQGGRVIVDKKKSGTRDPIFGRYVEVTTFEPFGNPWCLDFTELLETVSSALEM